MNTADRSIVRRESHFQAGDGTRLVRRSWHPADRSGGRARCLVLVHGFGEHSGRYDEMACWFALRGFDVHAYDHRGHGLSAGRRNFVGRARGFDEYVDDLQTFLDTVRAEHPDALHVLIGHSMGGLVVARALVQRAPAVDCAALSGAALGVSPSFSRARQWLARILAFLVPRLAIESGLPLDGLSRDPEVVRRYEADPLVDTRMTVGLAAGMLGAQRETAPLASRVAVPLLGLHGDADPICPAADTVRFLERVTTRGSACRTYPSLRHEIFNEPERETVWKDVLDFIEAAERERTA